MAPVASLTARAAVAAYRREPLFAGGAEVESILRRPEADPDGNVSAAFTRLRPAHPKLLIFYLLQSIVHVAYSAGDIAAHCGARADECQQRAAGARDLLKSCRGEVPLHLQAALVELAEFCEEQAKQYAKSPAEIGIKRTRQFANARATFALRHLGRRLRSELGIAHPDHDALKWLVETAMALNTEIPRYVVADALRHQVGVRTHGTPSELPKARKALKTKQISSS